MTQKSSKSLFFRVAHRGSARHNKKSLSICQPPIYILEIPHIVYSVQWVSEVKQSLVRELSLRKTLCLSPRTDFPQNEDTKAHFKNWEHLERPDGRQGDPNETACSGEVKTIARSFKRAPNSKLKYMFFLEPRGKDPD